MRINIGCGRTPTSGWRNFDNSPSLRLARIPRLAAILGRLGLLEGPQREFMEFACENGIEYGDAMRGLPLAGGSCDVIYSSHMLEHLDRNGATRFLNEALRLLRPGGIIRIAVPDIRRHVDEYERSGDADAFIEGMLVCVDQPFTLAQRLRQVLIGARHHQWMYDGKSLSRLLQKHDFVDVEVLPEGRTRIPDHEPLDVHERSSESVYVEARKPEA